MRAWPSAPVPDLPRQQVGPAPELTVYDVRSGRVCPTAPSGPARMYVCGITPYDATHLGHAATYVAFDLAVRAWRAAGHPTRYVQNVTDVDDPLLERAQATGVDWQELAERETDLFREDMTALRVLPPDVFMGAVEAIPLLTEVIGRLDDAGAVYRVDGDLYFSVTADTDFGAICGLTREQMLAVFGDRGGDPGRPGKRDPLDCLVWQRERPGEPAWDSPYGRGRPGWHIECAAIALQHLGMGFDIQGGGSDLAFPHHEMSAGEAQVAYPGQRFARAYVHAAMVGYHGEKMSKSRGNLVKVSQLRESGVDPRAVRLALLSQHYRTDWEWSEGLLDDAGKRLHQWTEAVRRGGPDATEAVREVHRALADDLDAPGALRAVDRWVASEAQPEPGAADLVRAVVDASLGVVLDD